MQENKTEKHSFWTQKLQEYKRSGLSRKAFSERCGFAKSTLDYWFRRIRKEEKINELVELKPPSGVISNSVLEIAVGKYSIKVHSGFNGYG